MQLMHAVPGLSVGIVPETHCAVVVQQCAKHPFARCDDFKHGDQSIYDFKLEDP